MSRTEPAALPHFDESEVAVLGAAILVERSLDDARATGLRPEEFYWPRHQAIYRAVLAIADRREPMDERIVWAECKRQGLLDADMHYVLALVDSVATTATVAQHAARVRDAARARAFVALARETIAEFCEDPADPEQTLDRFEARFLALRRDQATRGPRRLHEAGKEVFDALEVRSRSSRNITGITTGLADLDTITLGLQPGTLTILAARPSMGKSALAAQLALAASKSGRAAVVFSLEMGQSALYERVLCAEAKVPGDKFRKADRLDGPEYDRLEKVAKALKGLALYCDDSGTLTLSDLCARSRRLRGKEPTLGVVVVDYLQLLAGDGDGRKNREREVAEMSRGLKGLASDLGLTVVALSQLNREIEQSRTNAQAAATTQAGKPKAPAKRLPTMAHLRESGALEQDADLVMLLHREDYYREQRGEDYRDHVADLVVAKQRNGRTGIVQLRWSGETTQFFDLSRRESPKEGKQW